MMTSMSLAKIVLDWCFGMVALWFEYGPLFPMVNSNPQIENKMSKAFHIK